MHKLLEYRVKTDQSNVHRSTGICLVHVWVYFFYSMFNYVKLKSCLNVTGKHRGDFPILWTLS